jgi:hypothetical protein
MLEFAKRKDGYRESDFKLWKRATTTTVVRGADIFKFIVLEINSLNLVSFLDSYEFLEATTDDVGALSLISNWSLDPQTMPFPGLAW